MLTYRFVSRKEKKDSVRLRVTIDRKTSELSLGFSAPQELLDDIVAGSAPKAYGKQMQIVKQYRIIVEETKQEIIRDGDSWPTVAEFMLSVKTEVARRKGMPVPERRGNLVAYYEKTVKLRHSEGTIINMQRTLDKIKRFCEDPSNEFRIKPELLTFEHVTISWLYAFDAWMVDKGLSVNSRISHISHLKSVFNRAIDEELTDKYPFRRLKIKKEPTRKRSLPIEDLRKLFSYNVKEWQKFYIDMFKLSFFLIGMNPTDMFSLGNLVGGRAEYRRAKTGKLYSIKVEPEAMEIIERWRGEKNLLCLADKWKNPHNFCTQINLNLSRIGERIHKPGAPPRVEEVIPLFPDLSMYWARHSWATIAYEIGIPVDVISQALGHSPTNTTTEIYIRRDPKKVDAANRRVLDYVLYGKS